MTGGAAGAWREVAGGVLVRRHRTLDVNAGLVLGTSRCLVVDTRGCEREGGELLDAVRAVTRLPYVVVLTHAHFDHCFGTAAFTAAQPGCEVWAHPAGRRELTAHGLEHRADMAAWLRRSGDDDYAAEVERATVVPPTHEAAADTTLCLGGRDVVLHHPGRGHTDHDLVVDVPDAGVLFAGDLVEQGAPPSFDDAFPLEWPDALTEIAGTGRPVVVPGHGDVVDPAFVRAQRDDLAEVARAARRLPPGADEAVLEREANRLAVGGPAGFVALRRALAHLGTSG